jgi:hypothetical protein
MSESPEISSEIHQTPNPEPSQQTNLPPEPLYARIEPLIEHLDKLLHHQCIEYNADLSVELSKILGWLRNSKQNGYQLTKS